MMDLFQLLKECKKGSITAQRYFFDRYSKQLFVLCRRYVKTHEQAEEVLMTGFLKIFDSLGQFSYVNDSATIGWMQKIMINECLQALRKKHSFLLVPEETALDTPAEDTILPGINAEDIYRLIIQLPIGYRTVFNLFVIEEMTHKEIAAALNISEGTSKSQLSKARQLLQQMVSKQNAEQSHAKAL